ncbi:hypothetical protein WN944_021444 [Citrus x changshan-huyou]|uniref:Uncharacterized protein n=1 Tax=Citrus x changshan-huyou TaxID=2935761 RepID=A0AAP0R0F4_9ROSI
MTCTNIHVGAWRRLASLSKSPNLERECCCRGEDNKATEKPRGHKNQNRFWFPTLSHLQNNLRCIRIGIFSSLWFWTKCFGRPGLIIDVKQDNGERGACPLHQLN